MNLLVVSEEVDNDDVAVVVSPHSGGVVVPVLLSEGISELL